MPIEHLILNTSITDRENKLLNYTKLNWHTIMFGAAVVVNLSYVAIIVSMIG